MCKEKGRGQLTHAHIWKQTNHVTSKKLETDWNWPHLAWGGKQDETGRVGEGGGLLWFGWFGLFKPSHWLLFLPTCIILFLTALWSYIPSSFLSRRGMQAWQAHYSPWTGAVWHKCEYCLWGGCVHWWHGRHDDDRRGTPWGKLVTTLPPCPIPVISPVSISKPYYWLWKKLANILCGQCVCHAYALRKSGVEEEKPYSEAIGMPCVLGEAWWRARPGEEALQFSTFPAYLPPRALRVCVQHDLT